VTKSEKIKHSKPEIAPDSLSVAILKNVFFKRQRKNSSYSLRGFAKSLGISHTALSLIFSGKHKINPKFVSKVVDKLDLSFRQRKLFLAEHSHSIVNTKQDVSSADSQHLIEEDEFSMISEWQHYGILSLLETSDFKMDYAWIGKRLGISPLLAKTSIERLFRLRIIAKDAKGKWYRPKGYIRYNNKKSTTATRRLHQQFIKKGYQSLNEDSFDIRAHYAMTFAMNPKDIPYAVEKIKEFRYKLSEELEHMSNKEEVYNLYVQLYPLSRRSK
jgi:uncharacterized protein (TIGR02147 family)